MSAGAYGVKSGGESSFSSIYGELRDRISLLAYPPGSLLSENKLASEFGVSRTPIRHVLQRLEFDGLTTSRHGVGTIVTAPDFVYLKQVYALRLRLIDLTAELSPANVAQGDLAALEELLAEARRLGEGDEPEQLARLYLRFNQTVTRTIGNRPLREISERLFYQTSRVWLQALPEMDWQEELGAVRDEIEGVLCALRERDAKRVAEVRRRHLEASIQRINSRVGGLELRLEPREGA